MQLVLLGGEAPRQKRHHALRAAAAEMGNQQENPWPVIHDLWETSRISASISNRSYHQQLKCIFPKNFFLLTT
jgi:ABC-type uncharacterized transport system ATPase subunit